VNEYVRKLTQRAKQILVAASEDVPLLVRESADDFGEKLPTFVRPDVAGEGDVPAWSVRRFDGNTIDTGLDHMRSEMREIEMLAMTIAQERRGKDRRSRVLKKRLGGWLTHQGEIVDRKDHVLESEQRFDWDARRTFDDDRPRASSFECMCDGSIQRWAEII